MSAATMTTTAAAPATTAAPSTKAQSKWNQRQLRQMAAGGGAGIVAKTVVAPFERVKIVCQTGESVGMLETTKRILTTEGVVGFWRGNLAACVRVVPHKAILFGCSDVYKDAIRSVAPSESWTVAFVAGSLAGFTASMLTYPLDLIRTRLSGVIGTTNQHYNGIVHTFVATLQQEGPRALFRGIGPTLVGSIPYEGIKFGAYDVLKGLLPADIDNATAGYMSKLVCGGGAGMVATILTYPNDTVRRRLQMQGQRGAPKLYSSAIDCYRQLYRQHHGDVRVFYRGLAPTLVRAMPNMGVQFATYDVFKSWLVPESSK